MPRCYCFLCASDEGVFLEVTPENVRTVFSGQIEACLSKKVNQIIELSNKICYKCAYELDQCSKFLQKSKKSQNAERLPQTSKTVPHCSLCCEPVETGHIFDITEDNSVFSPLQKIRKIFSEDLYKKVSHSKLVCLVCRYNLDVLYDLKKLHEETVDTLQALINKELDYSSFPKVYTDVVNRKTTISTFPDTTVYGLISSDSESNDEMVETRRKLRGKLHGRPRGRPRGRPYKLTRGKITSVKNRNITKSQGDVKLKSRSCDQCSNIVANGLDMYRLHHTGQTVCKNCWITTDPNKGKSKKSWYSSSVETKLCTVYLKDVLNEGSHNSDNTCRKKEERNDELNVASDQSSQDEDTNRKMSLRKTRKTTVNSSVRQNKKRRRINAAKSDAESMPSKVRKSAVNMQNIRSAKALSDLDQPSTSFQKQQGHKRKDMSDLSTDSDYSQRSVSKRKTRRSERLISHVIEIISSASEEDVTNKRVKKQKFTEVTSSVRSESNDESSNETGGKDLKKKTKPNISSVASTRSRTRSPSISSKEMTPPAEFKSPKIMATQEYTCDKCSRKFNTKLAQAEHNLTHVNRPTLILEKLSILSEKKEEEEEESKVNSQKDKTASEEPEASTSGTTLDRNSADLSEVIDINLDDDTDDEIFQRSKDDEDDDQKEKLDMKKSEEEHQEDESSKIQVDEEAIASESQQHADSTAVSDETTIKVNDTNEDDTIPTDEVDASEDQDKHAREDDVDIVENCKDDEKENVIVEDDTEKTSTAEKEEECDKDLNDEIMVDNEKTESLDLSTIKNNKDNTVEHDESFESSLENNHKDDEDERTNDAEARLSVDLTNDFQEEDPKESEEKRLTPEVETLDDKEDSVIEYPKNRQKTINKQNTKIEEITDVDNCDGNTDSIIKPNLSNCEIHELENENEQKEEEDNDVVVDDIAIEKSKKATEGTVTIDDSSTENDFEQLMKNNKERKLQKSKKREEKVYSNSHNTSADTASEIMEEVFDLAAAEVKRRNSNGMKTNSDEDLETETLENISREIHNSADMPSLDADGATAVNDVNDITATSN